MSDTPPPGLQSRETPRWRKLDAGSAVPLALLCSGLAASACVFAVLAYALVGGSRRQTFCCSDVIHTLASVSNLSVDPCADFLNFVCHRRRELDEEGLAVHAVRTLVVQPTLQGRLQTPAAQILRTLHKSCLNAFIEGSLSPEATVSAVVAMFQEWSGSGAKLDLVKVLGLLHLRYNLPTVLSVSFSLRAEPAGTVRYSVKMAAQYAPRLLSSDDPGNVGNRMVEFLSARLLHHQATTNATVPERRAFGRQVQRANRLLQDSLRVFDDVVHRGDAGLLRRLFPQHDLRSWQEMLVDCCSSWDVAVADPDNLRNVLDALSDVALAEAFAAYFAIAVATSLFAEDFAQAKGGGDLMSRTKHCDETVLGMRPLWDVVSAWRLTSPEKDAAVRATFQSVQRAVVIEAAGLFAEHSDVDRLLDLVRSVRLLLPAEFAAPYGHILPKVTDTYLENKLAFRHFIFKASAVDTMRGLHGLWQARLSGTLEAFAARVGGKVVVAPSVYPLLSFETGSRAIVNAAVLGVSLADSMWGAVFAQRDWSVPLLQQLDAHRSCLHRYLRAELDSDLALPLLAVRSAARAAASPGWHDQAPAFGQWHLSGSQVFFMLFFLRHACLVPDERLSRDRPFMLRVAEFNAAFQCKPGPPIGIASCL